MPRRAIGNAPSKKKLKPISGPSPRKPASSAAAARPGIPKPGYVPRPSSTGRVTIGAGSVSKGPSTKPKKTLPKLKKVPKMKKITKAQQLAKFKKIR